MSGLQVSSANSKAMIAGFALVTTGGLISMCGLGLSGTAMDNAIRRWVRRQRERPSAIVKRKVAQALAAAGSDKFMAEPTRHQ
jgi:hypothetical protein